MAPTLRNNMNAYTFQSAERGWMEPARTLDTAVTPVAGVYVAVGTPLDHPCRIDSVYNFSDANLWVSLDGVEDHFPVKSNGGSVTDIAANGIVFPKGTQFYVKSLVAGTDPTAGLVTISSSYRVI